MINKKDIRDWMIQHNVYGGNIDQIDERLRCCQSENYYCYNTSADFDNNGDTLEDKFDGHFADIKHLRYSEIQDGEPCISYLDILDKL